MSIKSRKKIYIISAVIFLTVLFLIGYAKTNKESAKEDVKQIVEERDNQIEELQNKAGEQQMQITELQKFKDEQQKKEEDDILKQKEEDERQVKLDACLQWKNNCDNQIKDLDRISLGKKDGLKELDGFSVSSLVKAEKSLEKSWKDPMYEYDYKMIKNMIAENRKKISILVNGSCSGYKNPCE